VLSKEFQFEFERVLDRIVLPRESCKIESRSKRDNRGVKEERKFLAKTMRTFDTERFIEEIEKRPAIYDMNHGYNNRNAKMIAWEEVCQVMVPNWARLTDKERIVEGGMATAIDPAQFCHG